MWGLLGTLSYLSVGYGLAAAFAYYFPEQHTSLHRDNWWLLVTLTFLAWPIMLVVGVVIGSVRTFKVAENAGIARRVRIQDQEREARELATKRKAEQDRELA